MVNVTILIDIYIMTLVYSVLRTNTSVQTASCNRTPKEMTEDF